MPNRIAWDRRARVVAKRKRPRLRSEASAEKDDDAHQLDELA
jgi:hypothetical protein